MDSGNSASMQSSSCGDDDYDVVSRCEPSFAALLSSNSGNTSTDFSASFAQQPRRRQRLLPPSTFFDSLARPSPETVSPGQLLNLDPSWSMVTTQNCTNIAGSLMTNDVPPPPHTPLAPLSSDPTTSNLTTQRVGVTNPSLSSSDQAAATATTPRGSKKRPRASRRAPTTVLTTDTSNFRQMVQEFTGIPSPPFSSPMFPRARFDLFNSAAAASSFRSSPGAGGLPRPSAQKMSISTATPNPNLSFSPFAAIPSSIVAAGAVPSSVTRPATTINPSTTSIINTATATSTVSVSAPTVCAYQNSTGNYQQPPDLGRLTNESRSLFQSQLLAYQSLFRSSEQPSNPPQNYSLSSLLGSKAPAPTTTSMPPAAGASDQYNLSSGDTSTSHTATTLFRSERASLRGGGGSGAVDGDDLFGWGDGSGIAGGGGGDQAQFRPSGGHYRSSSSNNGPCKMNRTASSTSEFHAENNRSDNNVDNASRGEGTFDSWICSSEYEKHCLR